MAQTGSNRSRFWIVSLVLLFAAGLLYFVISGSRDRVVVRTATVAREDLISTIPTNGKVEPLVDFQAHAPVASVIRDLPVKLGERVTKGQELVRLDASDAQSRVASAEANLQTANATLANMRSGGTNDELLTERSDLAAAQTQAAQAATTLSSLQALQARGAASANEVAVASQHLNDSRTRVAQLQARMGGRYSAGDLSTQRAQVMEAQAALTSARSGYAGLDVRSPINGTVYSLPYARYDFVPAGDPLVNVADLNHLQVRAYFDEPEIGRLSAGEPVSITWDARPNDIWHGHVTQVPTTVITYNGTRNVGICLISVDDNHGDLIPNTNVTVRVTYSQHFGVLSLPREALHTEGARSFVFRIVAGKLVSTPVQLGDINLTRVEITGGLTPGDVIAVGALTDTDLVDGMRVKAQS